MDDDCIFCKIIAGEIPAQFAHRDDDMVAIVDAHPVAPKHLLVMPVKHVANLSSFVGWEQPELVAKLFSIAGQLGREQDARGYRVVVNEGPLGGQTVDHLHVHVLSGRQMTWPPG
ncbi:MAG: HIT domain-containing protein [Candidatus Eremiobacteraeota bacterium]|nr:HIT domain-containing protein [Candidatus Eremiobacteraeota bacterium]